MNRVRIVIEPEAKSEIRAARDYYSDKGDHTSERFRDELTQGFDLQARHPEAVAIAFVVPVSSQCDTFRSLLDTCISKAWSM